MTGGGWFTGLRVVLSQTFQYDPLMADGAAPIFYGSLELAEKEKLASAPPVRLKEPTLRGAALEPCAGLYACSYSSCQRFHMQPPPPPPSGAAESSVDFKSLPSAPTEAKPGWLPHFGQ